LFRAGEKPRYILFMNTTIKILIVEHDAVDLDLLHQELKAGKIIYVSEVVQNEADYVHALKKFIPDIILSDFTLPSFDGLAAFKIKEKIAPNTPFILVSGTIGEEKSVELIKSGVTDYALKDKLFTLTPKIHRALKESKERKLKNKTNQDLIQSEEKYRILVEQAFDGIIVYSDNGSILDCNHPACDYIGYTKKELKNLTIQDLFFEEDLLARPLYFETLETGQPSLDYRKLKKKDGSFLEMEIITKMMPDGNLVAIARDITEKMKAEETLRRMEHEISNQKIQEQKKITRAIITSQEKERNYIGQELHDNVNQILASTKMHLGMAAGGNEAMRELVKYPMELIDSTIREIRLLSSHQVTPLKNVALQELVQSQLDKLRENTGIQPKLVYSMSDRLIDDELKLNIYRIIQEQINNIVKYAEAKNTSVSIQADEKLMSVTIKDDGKGFDVKKKRKGIGISNMMNRVESFNGNMVVDSSPGKGCKIEVTIPY
jgi:two-component system sensor histidine kinase UhpB